MKNQNKRGFTLVELVIVIAVIAILAGVMIATFASVVNDAKESAELQEAQQAELAQKIDDVTKKLENPNWLTWEDFENELAEQLASVNTDESLTADEVKAVVEAALNSYAASQANKETGITEDQINLIVERTLAGSMTQAQVESIVKKYSANNLTQAQVSSIVNAAVANNLTAADVRAVVEASLSDVEADIDTLIANVQNIAKNALTKEQVAEIVANYTVNKVVLSGAITTEDLANLEDGAVVELGADASIAANLEIKANITLSLGESTLDLAGNQIITDADTTVTITGGTITTTGEDAIKANGNIVLNNTVINVADCGVYAVGGGRVVLNNVEINSEGYYSVFAGEASTVEINGGNMIGILSTNAKWVDGVQKNAKAQLIINGGTFTAPEVNEPAVYWQTGTLTINGGTFTADSSVLALCGGTANINGGTFVTTGLATAPMGATSGTFTDDKSVICVINGRSTSYPLNQITINSSNLDVTMPADYVLCTEYTGNFASNDTNNPSTDLKGLTVVSTSTNVTTTIVIGK